LHGHLLVGHAAKLPPGQGLEGLDGLDGLDKALSGLTLRLYGDGVLKDQGTGANVLDGPLQALLHFVKALRATPGAPTLAAGDIVTTGTLTDAHPVKAGECWHTEIDMPDRAQPDLRGLTVRFS
jgi:2-keto-4-pentenoate hydratase